MLSATNLKDDQLFTRFQTITKSRYFYLVLLAIVTFIIFCQVIGHEFVSYDDNLLVYENPYMQSFTIPNIIHFWENPDYGNLYIPLTQTIWAIQAVFAKTTPSGSNKIEFNPGIFHTTNLIFHILNAILVFLILRMLIKDELASFFGALLFALHPVQVEPVAWVTGLKEVLSGFFSLIAIWQYLLYAELSILAPEGNKTDQDYKKWKTLHYLMAIFSFLLAILSKPANVILPAVVFAIDYFLLKRPFRHIIVSLIGWVAIALPMIGVTIFLERTGIRTTFSVSFLERFLVASDTLAFYLYKLVLPVSLGPDYGRTPKFVLSQNLIYIAWLIPVIFLFLAYKLKKYRSWLLASAGVFIAGILPVLGFIQFRFQEISTVADRYLYISMLGPGMVLAYFLSLNKKRLVIGICGSILGVLGILSIQQTQYWENTTTFYKHAIEVNPDSGTFQLNFGVILAQQGKVDEAISHYSKALKRHPNVSLVHFSMGGAFEEQGKVDEAISHYSEAIKLLPNYVDAHINLGVILLRQGKVDEAISHFSDALKIHPNDKEALTNLGIALAQQGKVDEAISHFSEALKIDPKDAGSHTNLGFALTQKGKLNEAVFHFSEALRLSPDNAQAHMNLGLALEKSHQKNVEAHLHIGFALARQGKLNEAVFRYSEALKSSPNNVWAHNNLGIVLAQQGKVDEAIFHFSEALKINPGYKDAYKNLIKAKSLKK